MINQGMCRLWAAMILAGFFSGPVSGQKTVSDEAPLARSNIPPPRISGMAFDRSENAMVLAVDCDGLSNETVSILYKDLMPGQGYSDATPWQVAEDAIPVNGSTLMRWTDRGAVSRSKINEVVGRVYMIRRDEAVESPVARTVAALMAAEDEFQWPADRRAEWNLAGLPGATFPDYATVINVKNFGARADGVTDDSTAINNAINSATGPAVVLIPSGTYSVAKSIYLKSNIILRGEGSQKTKLLFKSSGTASRCIGAIKWDSDQTSPFVAVTNGFTQGSTTLFLAYVAGFAAGDVVEIQQQNDPVWGFVESWQANVVGQIARVVSVDSARRGLTIDQPLRISFSAARSPVARELNVLRGIGIENLYLEKKESIDGYTIEFKHVVDSWVRGVESYNTYKGHLWLERCSQIEVRQNYFHHSYVYGGNTQGYGVSCTRHTSGCLVEDNVFNSLRHSVVLEIGANGNVYGYNFSINRARDPVSGNLQADISVHGHYVFMNLFEGNVVEDADVPDWFEPAGPGNTLFRCRVMNSGTAIEVASDNENVVGNELPAGAVTVVSGVRNTLVHGNNSRGTITWSNGLSRVLSASLYRESKPEFIPASDPEILWPPLGPDRTLGAGQIPAQKRFASGVPVPAPGQDPVQSNACPSVAITSPSSGCLFTAPTNITLTAMAADSDGTVTQVTFYCGTALLGSGAGSSYQCVWQNAQTGSHVLTARAWDNQGASTVSTSISITVSSPVLPPSPATNLTNLALASRGSAITGNNGGSWGLLIDGNKTVYDGYAGYGYTYWPAGTMTLDLKSVCTVYSLRLLLWNQDSRYYQYKVEGSTDGLNWTMLADRTSGQWKSWQEITFTSPVEVRYLRLTGTYNSSNSGFHVVEWEVYGVLSGEVPPVMTPAIVTSAESLNVAEGGTETFGVRLSLAPTGNVAVSVSRVSGDTDVNVTGGSLLTFTTGTWSNYQTVTVAAAEDADWTNGSAAIRCSAAGLTNRDVTVTEVDNDTAPALPALTNLALASRGSTITGNNGGRWDLLIDGNKTVYSGSTGFGYTYWKEAPNLPGAMVLDLKSICTVHNIKLLLWDLSGRYYRYKMEGSTDGVNWTMLADRTSGQWKSWQEITFTSPVEVRYLRLTGTYNSSNSGFHVVEWEVYGVVGAEAPPELTNLAPASRGSTITGDNGGRWDLLIDGNKTVYSGSTGFGYTYWKEATNVPGAMVLDLKSICTVHNIKLLLWDLSGRYYRYKMEGSTDGVNWTMLADRTSGQWKSWQELMLMSPTEMRYLRLTGTYNSSNSGFHVVEWEVYGTVH